MRSKPGASAPTTGVAQPDAPRGNRRTRAAPPGCACSRSGARNQPKSGSPSICAGAGRASGAGHAGCGMCHSGPSLAVSRTRALDVARVHDHARRVGRRRHMVGWIGGGTPPRLAARPRVRHRPVPTRTGVIVHSRYVEARVRETLRRAAVAHPTSGVARSRLEPAQIEGSRSSAVSGN